MNPTVLGFSGAANIATTVKTKPKANKKSSALIAILPLLYEASSLGRLNVRCDGCHKNALLATGKANPPPIETEIRAYNEAKPRLMNHILPVADKASSAASRSR